MAVRTPLKRLGVMSTQLLRNEYYRDPALPILLGDDVLKACLRKGLNEGLFVYKEGDRLEGEGSPPGTLHISEDAQIFMIEKALEMGVWPPKSREDDQPHDQGPHHGPDQQSPLNPQRNTSDINTQRYEDERRKGEDRIAQTPSPNGVIERTDNVKTALTQLAQQVSSSGKAIKSLTWRMNSGDGFLPMALLKAEPGATVRVEMMEGGWSSGDGSAEWSFDFNGTPEEASHLRGFIEGQWRRGGEKSLDITYQLRYEPPLRWDDGGEGWIARLTRAGLSAQTATIRLELTAVGEEQP
jgi:hypothetical protein